MSDIESVKPTLTVILDDGDFIINSTGVVGKAMAQSVLPLAAGARKVTLITDGEMRVMKKNPGAANEKQQSAQQPTRRPSSPAVPEGSDVQDQFAADLEAGITGEQAMGEKPSPTPGPSDPVAVPAAPKTTTKRVPRIFQDGAAPPAPELAEAEMDRLLAEAQQAEADAARVAEDRRYQQQQAVQAGQEPAAEEAEPAPAQPRRRTRERALATSGRPCGRCGGAGSIVGDAGFAGACPVCHGEGQVKSWDRSLKVR